MVRNTESQMARNVIGLQNHQEQTADWIGMQTIRRRVAEIKQGWSIEERKARSAEGLRRREQLAKLVWGPENFQYPTQDCCASVSQSHIKDSSLVG